MLSLPDWQPKQSGAECRNLRRSILDVGVWDRDVVCVIAGHTMQATQCSRGAAKRKRNHVLQQLYFEDGECFLSAVESRKFQGRTDALDTYARLLVSDKGIAANFLSKLL